MTEKIELSADEQAAHDRAAYAKANPTHVGLVGDLTHPHHPEHFASEDRKEFLRRNHPPSAEAERKRREKAEEPLSDKNSVEDA